MTQPSVLPPHSRRPQQVWAAARADYEAGASLRIVAERHHLNIRTVSRHAHAEGWEAPDLKAHEAYDFSLQRRDYDPAAIHPMATVEHVFERDEERLLLCPDTYGLCRYAFRRAAEAAGVGGPTEALAWVRLADATARLRQRLDVDVHPMSEADYRRVAALSREEGEAYDIAVDAAPPDDGSEYPADDDAEDASASPFIPAKVSEVSESVRKCPTNFRGHGHFALD
ncbi:MAG: hypothetical protein EON96_07440 [Caulobacteraceae bacterium]|nr:MAG: hypothetical protein EON96_07440 [Caulobacteraceae bacterium]